MAEIKVDRDLCGEFLSFCPQDVYELDDEGIAFAARPDDCEEDLLSCGSMPTGRYIGGCL
ncbi:MAG: 4Fe-4S ferredoxin [Archaeoglobaceae archaeon]